MLEACDTDHLQQFLQNGNTCDLLIDAGWSKPLTQLTIIEMPNVIETIGLNQVIMKIKAEIDDFIKGLDDSGVLSHIQKNPDLFRPLFVESESQQLTTGMSCLLHLSLPVHI